MYAGRVYRRVDRGVEYPWVLVSVAAAVVVVAVGVEEEEGWERG
jgi:hypothetical protein